MRKPFDRTVTTGAENISSGRGELDAMFSAAYEELRRLAATVRQGDPAATLNPTALVHEAWLKMARSPGFVATDRLHFKRVAARAMRQLLVESARRRKARKRGGDGAVVFVSFDTDPAAAAVEEDVLRLDAALEALSQLSPRQAELVEGRFFGGLEVSEVAALLEVSEATALRDWRAAKAWLAQEIRAGR